MTFAPHYQPRKGLYEGKEEIRALLADLLVVTSMDSKSYKRVRKHRLQVVERLERLVGL